MIERPVKLNLLTLGARVSEHKPVAFGELTCGLNPQGHYVVRNLHLPLFVCINGVWYMAEKCRSYIKPLPDTLMLEHLEATLMPVPIKIPQDLLTAMVAPSS